MELDDLTFPNPGSKTLRGVLARAIPRVVQQFLDLPEPRRSGAVHARTRQLVQALARAEQGALVAVFRRPTVSCLVATATRSAGTDAYERAALALHLTVLLELAHLDRLPSEIRVERTLEDWPRILGVSGGLEVVIDASVAAITFARGGVTVAPGVRTTPAYVPIAPGVALALADDNPAATVQLHPERSGNALDLAGRDPGEWVTSLRGSLACIEQHLPELVPELRLLLQVIVPVGYDAERHASCSYPDSIGAVYLSLHPKPMTMTEAIVHEHQHQKLHLLERLGPLLLNTDDERYASPVRPDPRPLHGVLLAVHALQPIARLYERMLTADDPLAKSRDWKPRLRELVETTTTGAATLRQHARPTTLAAPVLRELLAIDAYFASEPSRALRA